MGLAKDTKIQTRAGNDYEQKYYVAAAETIYQGALVATTGGYLVNSATAANTTFVGIATEQADNAGGAAGAELCDVLMPLGVYVPWAGALQIHVGEVIYSTDENTITNLVGINNIRIGICTEAKPGIGLWINVRR